MGILAATNRLQFRSEKMKCLSGRRRNPGGCSRKSRQPTGSGIAFDDPFAHGFSQGLVDGAKLNRGGFPILSIDRLPSLLDQSSNFRLRIDVSDSFLDALMMSFDDRWVNSQ